MRASAVVHHRPEPREVAAEPPARRTTGAPGFRAHPPPGRGCRDGLCGAHRSPRVGRQGWWSGVLSGISSRSHGFGDTLMRYAPGSGGASRGLALPVAARTERVVASPGLRPAVRPPGRAQARTTSGLPAGRAAVPASVVAGGAQQDLAVATRAVEQAMRLHGDHSSGATDPSPGGEPEPPLTRASEPEPPKSAASPPESGGFQPSSTALGRTGCQPILASIARPLPHAIQTTSGLLCARHRGQADPRHEIRRPSMCTFRAVSGGPQASAMRLRLRRHAASRNRLRARHPA